MRRRKAPELFIRVKCGHTAMSRNREEPAMIEPTLEPWKGRRPIKSNMPSKSQTIKRYFMIHRSGTFLQILQSRGIEKCTLARVEGPSMPSCTEQRRGFMSCNVQEWSGIFHGRAKSLVPARAKRPRMSLQVTI